MSQNFEFLICFGQVATKSLVFFWYADFEYHLVYCFLQPMERSLQRRSNTLRTWSFNASNLNHIQTVVTSDGHISLNVNQKAVRLTVEDAKVAKNDEPFWMNFDLSVSSLIFSVSTQGSKSYADVALFGAHVLKFVQVSIATQYPNHKMDLFILIERLVRMVRSFHFFGSARMRYW